MNKLVLEDLNKLGQDREIQQVSPQTGVRSARCDIYWDKSKG